MKKLTQLIKELKYARKLHLAELSYRIKEQEKAIKEKDFVIKFLSSKEKKLNDIKKIKEILKKWQEGHYFS